MDDLEVEEGIMTYGTGEYLQVHRAVEVQRCPSSGLE